MSKTLILMRHGVVGGTDRRKFNGTFQAVSILGEDGLTDTDDVGDQLVDAHLVPQVIYHSPVYRVVETVQHLNNVFQQKARADVEEISVKKLSEGSSGYENGITDQEFEHMGRDFSTILIATHSPVGKILCKKFGAAIDDFQSGKAYVFTKDVNDWADFKDVSMRIIESDRVSAKSEHLRQRAALKPI